MALELLLAHADGNRPVLRQGIAAEKLLGAPPPPSGPMPENLWDENSDPNDLSKQRWGIVAPPGAEGDRLLELIAPLRRAREEAQGAPAIVYRPSPGPTEVLDDAWAMRWKQEEFRQEGGTESSLPRYLLLLGDLHQLPLGLQQVLATDAFVGRLAFPSEAGYEAYVRKVLRWEGMSAREKRARMLFYTSWAEEGATNSGYHGLVAPNIAACRHGQSLGEFPMADILELGSEQEVARERFLAQAAELGPGVMFSLSHGAAGSGEDRRERQGALLFSRDGVLLGKDVASRPFLPGGIWFFFACFSAGTPTHSSYAHWLRQLYADDPEELQSIVSELLPKGEKPFIAALPQAVLANPDGPLAVMGHVDLAWSYGYKDLGRPTPSRFLGVLKALAEGGRAGVALHALQRFVNETSIELTLLHNRQQAGAGRSQSVVDPMLWAELWMARQDLSNYILLGDPAVRLPLELSQQGLVPPGPVPPPVQAGRAVAEKAVLDLLSGRSLERVAAIHQVSPHELRRWEDIFRAAGRAALDQHFSTKS